MAGPSWSTARGAFGTALVRARREIGALRETAPRDRFGQALRALDRRLYAGLALALALLAGAAVFATKAAGLAADAAARAATAGNGVLSVPEVTVRAVDGKDLARVAESLRHRNVVLETPGAATLVVKANAFSHYRDWLGVLAALRAMTPQWRWSVETLCAGPKCPAPLSVALRADAITIAPPKKG